ncbi:hypothetical protein Pmani_024936 [Petrolisthes manimaculis]|uniref:PH domain-containing protein n=1 Tax=Petrolisthes manimaculis TaxID=1843537 RepID=A0AAE1TYU8_9EUCA|nr:hypothetical protein Pmani_024936 [Petrolisthes manimaculis]
MKTKKLSTPEKYTAVAVRAKLSVEVEQRKRLGAWAKRVLVLDGTTLYAYKTKGEGGSVGGWEVVGAEVHVRRSSDSGREDGRHLLVIARPPAYKLTFSFTTTYEQARMIQALSSSGATVTGLDAIMLLKNLRKQQEEAQREEEQRLKHQKEQKEALEEAEWESEALLDGTQDEVKQKAERQDNEMREIEVANNEGIKTDDVKNEEEEELEEINQSIYHVGAVSNPLYSSLTRRHEGGGGGGGGEVLLEGTRETHMQTNGTSEASRKDSVAYDESGTNQNTDVKVNPLPKPPRSLFQDRRPSGADDNNDTTTEDVLSQGPQSTSVVGEGRSGKHSGQAEFELVFGGESENEDELVEATNLVYSESDDSEEGKGFYEVNPESTESIRESETDDNITRNNSSHNENVREEVTETREDRLDEEEDRRDEEYIDLVTKMRLERGFIIDTNNTEGSPQNLASPETIRKHSANSYGDSLSTSPTDSPIIKRNLNNKQDNEGNNTTMSPNNEDAHEVTGLYRNSLTESEEKFEELYKELSQSIPNSSQGSDNSDDKQLRNELVETDNGSSDQSKVSSLEVTVSEHVVRDNDVKETIVRDSGDAATTVINANENDADKNGVVEGDETDAPGKSTPEMAPVKKVNSIIKKKKSPDSRSGSLKRVQFNIDVETVKPSSSTPDDTTNSSTQDPNTKKKKDAKGKESTPTSQKDKKQESSGSPKKSTQPNNVTSSSSPTKKSISVSSIKKKPQQEGGKLSSASPTKKKGIFSTIFSTNSGKKNETQPVKENASKKIETQQFVDDVTVKAGTPATSGLVNKDKSGGQGSINKDAATTSTSTLKRQSTVDLNAPLILSGQVEMGGSVGGRLSARRMEVRDGHLLAFLPRTTAAPNSRLKLNALSVMPVVGAGQPNTLVLSRAARVMMVLKLGSREEMMRWINVLSDEVIKATPDDQRKGLTLYPSLKKEEEEEEEMEKEVKEEVDTTLKDGLDVSDGKEEVLQITMSNGHIEVKNVLSDEEKTEGRVPTPDNKKQKQFNGVATKEDPKVTVRKNKKPLGPRRSISMDHLNDVNERMKVTRPQYHKEAESDNESRVVSQVQKKIQQFSMQFKEKDSRTKSYTEHSKSGQVRRTSHPQLRRLSGHGKVSPQPLGVEHDEVDNYLMVDKFMESSARRHDKCIHDHKVDFIRYVSSSQSSLAASTDSRRETQRPLQRYGSGTILSPKHKDKPDHQETRSSEDKKLQERTTVSEIEDSHNEARSSESVIPQVTTIPADISEIKSLAQPVPTYPTVLQPRNVEIIERTQSSTSPTDVNVEREGNSKSKNTRRPNNRTEVPTPPPAQEEELPRITWSVAATREKFELLAVLSGENKGKLTTKNPISRKRSTRGTVKKKRSLEGANVSRRASVKRSGAKAAKAALLADDTYLSSSQEFQSDNDVVVTKPHKQPDSASPRPVRDTPGKQELTRFSNSSSSITDMASSTDDLNIKNHGDSTPQKENIGPPKSPLRRTSNVLLDQSYPSSPEPDFISSRLINTRPHGKSPRLGRIKTPSLQSSRSTSKDNDVVVCWRGPYIAQDVGGNPMCVELRRSRRRKQARRVVTLEEEQKVLANISNAFLAKRRLLAREVTAAKIQERLSALEERQWELQNKMGEIDQAGVHSSRETREWRNLERSLKAVEDETTYWSARMAQTEKEADDARQKLSNALTPSLSQQSVNTPHNRSSTGCGDETDIEDGDAVFEDASEA